MECSVGAGILCVVAFLGVQALLTWMENAPTKHLAILLATLATLVGAWICYRIIGDHYRDYP